jgi:hypothetical protein
MAVCPYEGYTMAVGCMRVLCKPGTRMTDSHECRNFGWEHGARGTCYRSWYHSDCGSTPTSIYLAGLPVSAGDRVGPQSWEGPCGTFPPDEISAQTQRVVGAGFTVAQGSMHIVIMAAR